MQKIYGNLCKVHFSWVYTFCHVQLYAELDKPQEIPVATQHSCGIVLIS